MPLKSYDSYLLPEVGLLNSKVNSGNVCSRLTVLSCFLKCYIGDQIKYNWFIQKKGLEMPQNYFYNTFFRNNL